MKKLRSLATIASAALVLAGCSNPLVGTWRNVRQNGRPIPPRDQLTTTFTPFGRITLSDARSGQHSGGSYTVRADRVTLTSDHRGQTYRYTISGNELRLDDGRSSVVMKRVPTVTAAAR